MRKIKNKWFTLVELVVSITIFTIILWTAYAQFPYLMGSIKKIWNEKVLLNESINFKEELLFNNKLIAFYTYKSIQDWLKTQYDMENIFRKNIKEIIENVIENKYVLSNYDLSNPLSCSLPYNNNFYFTEFDKSILNDEFNLGSCNNNINDIEFNNNYKILTVVDTKTLVVSIYFSYKSILHKITTKLITDLDDDNIIFTNMSSWKISFKAYKNFEINKFSWITYNYCSLDNTPWEECIFTDYNKKQNKQWKLDISIYRLTKYANEINIKTSYILKNLFSLN